MSKTSRRKRWRNYWEQYLNPVLKSTSPEEWLRNAPNNLKGVEELKDFYQFEIIQNQRMQSQKKIEELLKGLSKNE